MTFSTQMVDKYNSIVEDIFNIMRNDWDPLNIGFMDKDGTLAKTEYSYYLPSVMKILLSEMSDDEIEAALIKIVANMNKASPEDVVPFPEVVKKFLDIRSDVKKYFALSKQEQSSYSKEEFMRLKALEDELNSYLDP